MGVEDFATYLQVATNLLVCLSILWLVPSFIINKRKETERYELETYNKLNDEYLRILEVLLNNVGLDLYADTGEAYSQDPLVKRKRLLIYSMLITLFERAYILLYEGKSDRARDRRWKGWEEYIKEWCSRPDFRVHLQDSLKNDDVGLKKLIELLEKQSLEQQQKLELSRDTSVKH
jgi:hypothetical protein